MAAIFGQFRANFIFSGALGRNVYLIGHLLQFLCYHFGGNVFLFHVWWFQQLCQNVFFLVIILVITLILENERWDKHPPII